MKSVEILFFPVQNSVCPGQKAVLRTPMPRMSKLLANNLYVELADEKHSFMNPTKVGFYFTNISLAAFLH